MLATPLALTGRGLLGSAGIDLRLLGCGPLGGVAGRPLIVDKPRSATIISDIRSRTAPLPPGLYRVTLRAAGKVVFVSSIRIG